MKKIIVAFVLLVGVLGVSCKKGNEAQPQNPDAAPVPKSINVEYRIQSQSGDVIANYLAPGADGKLVMVNETINRTYKTINFNYTSGNLFSVEASNETPSHSIVQVQIYVNGTLFKEGSSSGPAEKAIAQGNY